MTRRQEVLYFLPFFCVLTIHTANSIQEHNPNFDFSRFSGMVQHYTLYK